MGASQSKSETNLKVFRHDTPIHLSHGVVNQLSDRLASPETTPERQSTLDNHIRSRIQNELELLRQEEENVRREIEQALEKENLEQEKKMAGMASESDRNAAGGVESSSSLIGDLQEIQTKVDRFQSWNNLSDFIDVKAHREDVMSCYHAHPTTPLECWRQVNKFKASVAQVEQQYFQSLK